MHVHLAAESFPVDALALALVRAQAAGRRAGVRVPAGVCLCCVEVVQPGTIHWWDVRACAVEVCRHRLQLPESCRRCGGV
jgi:hypothetical protein